MKETRFKTANDVRDYLAAIMSRAEAGELSARESTGIAALCRVQLRCIEIADEPERTLIAYSKEDPLAYLDTLQARQEAAAFLKDTLHRR